MDNGSVPGRFNGNTTGTRIPVTSGDYFSHGRTIEVAALMDRRLWRLPWAGGGAGNAPLLRNEQKGNARLTKQT